MGGAFETFLDENTVGPVAVEHPPCIANECAADKHVARIDFTKFNFAAEPVRSVGVALVKADEIHVEVADRFPEVGV
jgi:hypothetical protein